MAASSVVLLQAAEADDVCAKHLCDRPAVRWGLCAAHEANSITICSHVGCARTLSPSGSCRRHGRAGAAVIGASKRVIDESSDDEDELLPSKCRKLDSSDDDDHDDACATKGCTQRAAKHGTLCALHEAPTPGLCNVPGCETPCFPDGLCEAHGSVEAVTTVLVEEDVPTPAQAKGSKRSPEPKKSRCRTKTLCTVSECENRAVLKGKCKRHGGFRICVREKCNRPRHEAGGLCSRHGRVSVSSSTGSAARNAKMAKEAHHPAGHKMESSKWKCSVAECETRVELFGVCAAHASHARRCAVAACGEIAHGIGKNCRAHMAI